MKRWLCACACGLWLWAGAAARADDMYLSGGVVLPVEEAETAPVETSLLGSLLAERMRDAVTEDKLSKTIDRLGLYDKEDTVKRDGLARLASRILLGGQFSILKAADGKAAGIFLTVHVSGEEERALNRLLAGAREPDLPIKGAVRRRRNDSITAGDFSLVETSPLRRGISEGGVPYRWGDAVIAYAGRLHLTLPFTAVYARQDGPDGEMYSIFLALPDGARYFLPRLEAGFKNARLGEAPAEETP